MVGRKPSPPADPAAAWGERAEELVKWAMCRVFVRVDRFGHYKTEPVTGEKSAATGWWPAGRDFGKWRLGSHFTATGRDAVTGAHALTPTTGPDDPCFGKWVAVDIDNHSDTDSPEWNTAYALKLYSDLAGIGFRPLLVHWDAGNGLGHGGFHLWVFFDRQVSGKLLHRFATWIVRSAGRFAVRVGEKVVRHEGEVETFPKKHTSWTGTNGKGLGGGWIRLPGRHHTRPVFASVFDEHRWVEGATAVETILSLNGDSPDLIPADARIYDPPVTKKAGAGGGGAGGMRITSGRWKEGGRNDGVYWLACRMVERGRCFDLGLIEVKRLNRALCVPPLGDDEVTRTVASAYSREGRA
jgi:hypothetical protein